MEDVSPLLTAVDRLADRLRALPQSRLRGGAAAEGLALARELAMRAQRLEEPEREPRTMPDAGLFAVADQLAVAGHDLAHALAHDRRTPGESGEPGPGPGGEGGAADELGSALALVDRTAKRCRL